MAKKTDISSIFMGEKVVAAIFCAFEGGGGNEITVVSLKIIVYFRHITQRISVAPHLIYL
jgi:hypothetical protein